MAELDPYATLGVPRTAARAEIARAYRALAKRHHPDAGAPPSPTMSRINEAWYILSDPTRRARWDQGHALVAPPHWQPAPAGPVHRPPPQPAAPPSRMDSGWVVAGIVLGITALVAVVMVGVYAASQPAASPSDRFSSPVVVLSYPADWVAARGRSDQPEAHRILVHLASFGVPADELCTRYGEPCGVEPADVPPGESSVTVVAFEGGTPPVPEPLVERPFGLDADDMIDGRPAAIEERSLGPGTTLVWWQLSPPGFPDRWIEVSAILGGVDEDLEAARTEVQAVLESVEFPD